EGKRRPVDGQALGQLLHDHGSPVLVLNACQSAMHEAASAPSAEVGVHEEIRAIGSLSQAVIDQGVPAVLGMRYSVFVVTAAQYVGELYRTLAQGQTFGEAASTGRKHLFHNPERWLGLQPQVLQDWCVPVVYEAKPIRLLPSGKGGLNLNTGGEERDPAQTSSTLRRHVPPGGFIGRDETLLALDRAFDTHRIVLLHAYAGQGKSSTAVEFARWYALTGGLGHPPIVLFSSFEQHLDLASLLNQLATPFLPLLEASNIHWHTINQPDKRRALVLQLLRQIPALWIWDNVEPVAGFPAGTPSQWTAAEQEDLRDFLQQISIDTRSQVKLLLTSRRDEQGWLGALPHRIQMPRMSDEDAALLAQQLGAERKITRSEVGDWQPLLDYCSGNPLTLRVLVGQALRERLHGAEKIRLFTDAIRSGEQAILDTDVSQGRDRSLGASLDYGFKHAFKDDELPIIALLHLFQGTVDVDALVWMGKGEHALPEVRGRNKEQITALLHRAGETGLLTHLAGTWFTIHPALPWFLSQLFARHYDGQAGRSSSQVAQRAWVEAVTLLGHYYLVQYAGGKREVIALLELEESNLLFARRLARRQQWWTPVISAMQGLRALYNHNGRSVEWARLVAEIVPDYCSPEDEPLTMREDVYSCVMEYRVHIAQEVERDSARALSLQKKRVAHDRLRAEEALAVPVDNKTPLALRNAVRMLAVSLEMLGRLQRDAQEAACVGSFQEAGSLLGRIGDRTAHAIVELDLGHAYKDLPSLRDLDAATAAYQRALELYAPGDALGRSGCLHQIAMVHHERFREAREAEEAMEILLKHANAALYGYQAALQLCPPNALTERGSMYHQLGNLHSDVGWWDDAREQYAQAIQCREATGNRHSVGQARHGMAVMYLKASRHQLQPGARQDFLLRAQAYAQAALRDFQHYQGRAAADEARAQRLLDIIALTLQELSD
ncbi:MAG TPA: CHAT domain-containing protein, partial [Prosthecobacter sp.]